ncbi:hypothetical protein E2C01_024781 [Portunus trituberculatus]|uniref:Uncharacterized protein n=1 Tax=Portunus trituberculatus TaxID=210409 RepID=A0A5B7EB75_PORTR|nr:hypothetical protein [Portunus trituberculatus]
MTSHDARKIKYLRDITHLKLTRNYNLKKNGIYGGCFTFTVTMRRHRSKIQAPGSQPGPALPLGLPRPSQTQSTVHASGNRSQTSGSFFKVTELALVTTWVHAKLNWSLIDWLECMLCHLPLTLGCTMP